MAVISVHLAHHVTLLIWISEINFTVLGTVVSHFSASITTVVHALIVVSEAVTPASVSTAVVVASHVPFFHVSSMSIGTPLILVAVSHVHVEVS